MSEHNLLNSLEKMLSEQRNPNTLHIDSLPSLDIVTLLNNEDKLVALVVEKKSAANRAGGRTHCGGISDRRPFGVYGRRYQRSPWRVGCF